MNEWMNDWVEILPIFFLCSPNKGFFSVCNNRQGVWSWYPVLDVGNPDLKPLSVFGSLLVLSVSAWVLSVAIIIVKYECKWEMKTIFFSPDVSNKAFKFRFKGRGKSIKWFCAKYRSEKVDLISKRLNSCPDGTALMSQCLGCFCPDEAQSHRKSASAPRPPALLAVPSCRTSVMESLGGWEGHLSGTAFVHLAGLCESAPGFLLFWTAPLGNPKSLEGQRVLRRRWVAAVSLNFCIRAGWPFDSQIIELERGRVGQWKQFNQVNLMNVVWIFESIIRYERSTALNVPHLGEKNQDQNTVKSPI